ncbi:response regulator [uncultured Flavobacterium sp.]|uniref:response regulator n=1 Tax=uncultured Flavobacterium sp. TaxID=165435 RepID=UPI0030ECEC0F|tara:strand:+ start:53995 stop:54393 length:399 start_codon:yes stop_codon:yes gene_type:complete
MAQIKRRFILIDDDNISNLLTKMVLKKAFYSAEVLVFTVAEEGLAFIKSDSESIHNFDKIILLLDINMPSLTGWEFLEEFKLFDEAIKKQYHIYIHSSSINAIDINLAKENKLVLDYLEKPINKDKFLKLLS